jgi:hypothetical protein
MRAEQENGYEGGAGRYEEGLGQTDALAPCQY